MTTNFLGIPIDGEITQADKRTPQRPLEDLAPIMQAVLDDDGITSFGWWQFTPYFNDGDPCVFGVGSMWVRTVHDTDEDADEYYLGVSGTHPTLGNQRWDGSQYVTYDNERNDADRYERCKALSEAIDSGAFDDVLLEAFGDHARVTVARGGISIEFYEHE